MIRREPEKTHAAISPGNTTANKNGVNDARKRGKKRARPTDTDEEQDVQMANPVPVNESTSRRKMRKVTRENDFTDHNPDEVIDLDSDQDSTYAPDEDNLEEESAPASDARIKEEVEDISLNISAIKEFAHPIDVDEDEKPKMSMYLSYRGSHIPGRFLCVIVEPYPPLLPEQIPREATVEPPEIRFQVAPAIPMLQLRDSSRAPSVRPDSIRARSETPLFLPDDENYRGRAETSTIGQNQSRPLPPVPRFNQGDRIEEDEEGEDDDVRLLSFSQAMVGVGHEEGGEDSDEDYLKGDADENVRVIE
jgi:hypothetical protein